MMNRNIQFSLLISFGKQLHEFNFRKRSPDLYDADTSDDRGTRHYFKMIKDGNSWKIQGVNLPAWITSNEIPILEAFINQDNT